MQERLTDFASRLREQGLRLSTAELLDGLAAVQAIGLADPEALREALRATWVKRQADVPLFDELFELCLLPHGQRSSSRSEASEEAPLVGRLRERGLSEQEIEQLLALLADEASRMSPLGRMSLGLRRAPLEALIRLAGLRLQFDRGTNPLQLGFLTQKLLESLGVKSATEELSQLGRRLARSIGQERAQVVLDEAMRTLEGARSEVRGYVRDELEAARRAWLEEARRGLLETKPFAALTEEELRRLRHEVERLAERLRATASRRPVRRRRGRLDVARTLRRSLGTGGVPMRLVLRERPVERPRLVVLCDISDSVRHVSRFMLQLAYSLQQRFSQVRSYVFVGDLAECTELFRRYALHEAVDLANAGGVVNVYANSNFGRAFRTFVERHLDVVTSRTTVIVLGDGRNNYNPPESWALGRVAERARRVLWLNPEPRGAWEFGDSAMRDYAPHCARVESVTNLASLSRVLDELVL